jgi:hypothetical protein
MGCASPLAIRVENQESLPVVSVRAGVSAFVFLSQDGAG